MNPRPPAGSPPRRPQPFLTAWISAMPHLIIGLCLTALVAFALAVADRHLAALIVSQLGTLLSLGLGGLWLDRRR